jgi:hypothetical protein
MAGERAGGYTWDESLPSDCDGAPMSDEVTRILSAIEEGI